MRCSSSLRTLRALGEMSRAFGAQEVRRSEWSRWEPSDMDGQPERVNERERMNQSAAKGTEDLHAAPTELGCFAWEAIDMSRLTAVKVAQPFRP